VPATGVRILECRLHPAAQLGDRRDLAEVFIALIARADADGQLEWTVAEDSTAVLRRLPDDGARWPGPRTEPGAQIRGARRQGNRPDGALAPRRARVPDQELGRLPWLAFFFLRPRLLLPVFAMSLSLAGAPVRGS